MEQAEADPILQKLIPSLDNCKVHFKAFPANVEQGVLVTHPNPLVLQFDKKTLHSLFVVAVVLWLHYLSIQEAREFSKAVDQHGIVSLTPLKVLH